MAYKHRIANLDRREYLDARAFADFSGELATLNESDGAMWGLTLLLAAAGERAGHGDVTGGSGLEPVEPSAHTCALLGLVGRWAGERIAIVSEDFSPATEAEYRVGEGDEMWAQMSEQEGWVDISEHVVELIELDEDSRTSRHEPVEAPSGQTWTQAQGFSHERTLPAAPRSVMDEDGTIEAIPALPPVDVSLLDLEADPIDPARTHELEAAIDDATNLLGPLDDACRERLRMAALHPCSHTWSDAYSLNVCGWTTLWQAVGKADPTFPSSVASDEVDNHLWERVPSGELILAALQLAVMV
jgi:hypothetical protein